MRKRWSSWVAFGVGLLALVASDAHIPAAQSLDPIVYTIRAPAPDTHIAEVEASVPTGNQASIELMMAVWSPGFYRVENYAARIQDFTARTPDGASLHVEQPAKNRWRIASLGAPAVIIAYHLLCSGRSVTANWVGTDLAVLNGPATFVTLVEPVKRPSEVRLELPPVWKQSMTSLDAAPDGLPNHYRAPDYDTLADSPIVAGNLTIHEFAVDGSRHYLVDLGDVGQWDGQQAAQQVRKFVQEDRRFWGFLPFKKYVFLNVFRQGGGGLEHLNSTLLTASSTSATPTVRWLKFVSHEYFHAFNVKRLRPIELGPFDYENPPHTPSLWISEGVTTYYGDLAVDRSGVGASESLSSADDFLSGMSGAIRQLQNSPGRLVQTLEQASLDVWTASNSGVGGNANTTVSYYTKGLVAGFLLDARIRHATNDVKSLDDVMRLAYKRYGGARGFKPEEFQATASEVAGVDLSAWFAKTLVSTEELDYSEVLDWYGLRFAQADRPDPAKAWTIEIRADATDAQKHHLEHLMAPGVD